VKIKLEIVLLVLHIFIGMAISTLRSVSKLYELVIIVGLFALVFFSKNKQRTILLSCAYVAGSDVFIRMTGGGVSHEMHKYLVIIFMIFGIFTRGGITKGYQYILFMFLLMPAILVGDYSFEDELRKYIAFNLAGPFALAISAFYLYKRKISFKDINDTLYWFVLPVVSMGVYMFFYSASAKDVFTSTASNFDASGGFGPNQVATILGIAIFIMLTRLILTFKFLDIKTIINFVLLLFFTYRGIITFSRGGVLTALIVSVLFLGVVFIYSKTKIKFRIIMLVAVLGIAGMGVWGYASLQTSGLIDKRYNNQNVSGTQKEDVSSGRTELFQYEYQAFKENPIFGIGVGKVKEYRFVRTGIEAATHNELSRIMAEHGMFGLLGMFILLTVPFLVRLRNRSNIYFYSFFFIWFLTINHSATRIVAPAFIYALSLIDVQYTKQSNPKKKPQHSKQ
jgi:O-antigen ligase